MNKSMWNNEAVKAYESGQGVVLVEKPYPHYEPQRTWQGLTEEEFVYFCSYVDHDTLSQIENVLRDKNE
jgi:hypothetical protein